MSRPAQLAIMMSILAVAVRLICIDQPYIDNWSWRQSDVAAIARNYFQGGYHFAYPQIDWAGDRPGYVGTEFPILPLFAAICYKIFGVHEWIGRVQAVVLFAVSLPFFFLVVRKIFGEMAGIWALFFYSFAPLGIMAGRCFMPDVPSLAFSIIGLYFFQRWIDESEPDGCTRSTMFLSAAAVAISLSILIKAPSAIIGAPLACLAWERFRFSSPRRIELWLFAAIALVPSSIWYWHAHNVAEQFYPHHFFGAGGFKIEPVSWYWNIAERFFARGITPIPFVLGVIGVFIARPTIKSRAFCAWLGAMIVFFFMAGYGNRHPWYQLPFVPILAAFAGAACVWLRRKFQPGFVFLIGFAALVWSVLVYHDFLAPVDEPLRLAGLELKNIIAPNDLIVASNYGDPNIFYYAERRGWHLMEDGGIYNGHPINSADAIADLEQLRKRGATYLVFYSGTFWWLDYYKEFAQHVDLTARLIEATPQFKIYKLNPR